MQKEFYLFKIIKSNYCKIVFLVSFILAYFLIPSKVFYGVYLVIVILFMLLFAFIMTCLVRNAKEKVLLAKKNKSSLWVIILVVIGFSTLQVCGVGAPVCGATIGLSVVSLFFPSIALNFMTDYSFYIILTIILIQIISLYQMKCFKKVPCSE